MQIKLPWPHKDLSPNARVHHHALARVKAAYKEACIWDSKAQGLSRMALDALHVSITFCAPDNRRRDLDNMLASVKAAVDAISFVTGVDDSKWTIAIRKGEKGGYVLFDISPVPMATEEQQAAQCQVCKAIQHHKKNNTAQWLRLRGLLTEMEQLI
ncbi:hypothetical protein [Thalassospira alkalitolerans]|uniref:hypothetical protein n=1 Tax=Thalassospira alkalitolerans TaxID=1293890 RepID=UPI003AA99ED2